MKKIILILLGVTGLLTFSIVSCNKNSEDVKSAEIEFSQKSDYAKSVIVSNDKDWKVIAAKNLEVISKLVESNVDINSLDFKSEESFLNAIGMTKNQYLQNVAETKSAADRLIKRYNLLPPTLSAEKVNSCVTCKISEDEMVLKLKKEILALKSSTTKFTKFKNLLTVSNSSAPEELPGEGGGCCPWQFYACCTVCAGTIPAFFAYLACCSLCYSQFCCS